MHHAHEPLTRGRVATTTSWPTPLADATGLGTPRVCRLHNLPATRCPISLRKFQSPDPGISALGPGPARFKSLYGKIEFCMGRPSEQYNNCVPTYPWGFTGVRVGKAVI